MKNDSHSLINFKIPKYYPYNAYSFHQEELDPQLLNCSFLEREKEINKELKTRYELQLKLNSELSDRLKDSENVVNYLKQDCENIKKKLNEDILIEKEKTIQLEQQYFLLKEEILNKEIKWRNITSNLNFQIEDLKLNSHSDSLECKKLEMEIQRLNSQLNSLMILNDEKISNIKEYYLKLQEKEKKENEMNLKEAENIYKNNLDNWTTKYHNIILENKNLKLSKEKLYNDNLAFENRIKELNMIHDSEINNLEIKIKKSEVNYVNF